MSLKQEGISYLAGAELPAVIVDMMRGGPRLGVYQPAQSDYFQATRGGGHGDYRILVLAPSTLQEASDLTEEAFDMADGYRIPVIVLADGMVGQMMEAIEWRKPPARELKEKTWAAVGTNDAREPNIINSLYIDAKDCAAHNERLRQKHARIAERETRYEAYQTEDAEVIFVAYGTTARISRAAVIQLREQGIRAGLFPPDHTLAVSGGGA